MILPLLKIIRSLVLGTNQSMRTFYELYGMSRQSYHKAVKRLDSEKLMMEDLLQEINQYRSSIDRRAGSRSLYYNLDIKSRYDLGVTKFENLLSKYQLTLIKLSTRVITTQSCHQSWNYDNLTNGLVLNGLNQLVVGDITYLNLGKARYYLFCLTDVFTMRIVGHCLSRRMRKEEALICLRKCIILRKRKNLSTCIHHTDGGGQYFSEVYLKELPKGMRVSVARSCIENGLAEQKNGFIKHHLIPTMDLSDESKLVKEMNRVINHYNGFRKQAALGWRSPIEFEKHLKTHEKEITYRLHDHNLNVCSKRHGF